MMLALLVQVTRITLSMFHFGTEQLMWPVLKGPEGPDQPWRLLSKQSSQS